MTDPVPTLSPSAPDLLPREGRRWLLIGFGLVTGSLLGAQLVLSRLFASTLGCYYAFALVSLAMLGLGAAGLVVQLAPAWFPRDRLARISALASLAMSASAVGGLMVYLGLYPGPTRGTWLWTLGVFSSFLPFFCCGGAVVSLILAHGRGEFHRLYSLDLTSAAVGCVGALAVLSLLYPVQAVLYVLGGIPILAAILFALAHRSRGLAWISLAACLGLLVGATALGRDPAFSDPPHTSRLRQTRLHHATNSVSNVSVFEGSYLTWALSPLYRGPFPSTVDLVIDGVGGTGIVEFDGQVSTLATERYRYLDQDMTALGQAMVPPRGRHLIIGPGGGVDILQSVRHGRSDITAVEINSLVARVVNQDLAAFSGRPYHLPGVHVLLENGRTFAERTRETWQLISLTWVDTGGQASAMASSENYLYTVESYERMMSRLEPDGFFACMRALGLGGDLRIDGVRGVTVAVEALRRLGASRPEAHLIASAVASPFFGDRAMLYLLAKRTPLTTGEIVRARSFIEQHGFVPIWLPGGVDSGIEPAFAERAKLVQELITTSDPAASWARATLDVAPTTDDNPFYFVERAGPNRAAGEGITLLERIVSVLGLLVLPFLGLPMIPMFRRTERLGAGGLAALSYFTLLGIGFMLVEVELFQVYALVLGSPATAIVTILGTLLVSSGMGSLRAERLARASGRVTAGVFALLVVGLAAFAAFKGPLLVWMVALPFGVRLVGTIVTLLPLGFLMGLPMATGMSRIATRRDIVLWGWALNGAFSVFAGVLAVYGAIHFGFTRTFFVGVGCYLVALICLGIVRRYPVAPPTTQAG